MGKTTNQHFVPQFYLREFCVNKKQILEYDLHNNGIVHTKTISTSCSIDNFYEYKDSEGRIVRVNEIEKIFGLLETRVSHTFKSIKRKAFIKNNKLSCCFLTTNEKENLVLFIATMAFRNPELINEVIKELNDLNGCPEELKPEFKSMSQYEKKNLALSLALPFGKIEESQAWKDFLSALCNMSFMIVAVQDKDVFITSDKPVMVYPKKDSMSLADVDTVILPLSPRICLYLSSDRYTINERNCLRIVKSSNSCLKGVNDDVAALATRYLYTNQYLSSKEIKRLCKSYYDYQELINDESKS